MSIGGLLGVIVGLLDDAAIPYMVVGSFASSLHGEPRSTFDLDIVIDPDRARLDAFLAAVPDRFYLDADVARDAFARRSMFNMIDQDSGWKIDLIVRKDRAFSRGEMSRRQRSTIEGTEVFVASAEDVVLSKLEWAKEGESSRQLDDVRRLLKVQTSLDTEYLARWVGALDLGAQWDAVTG